MPGAPVPPGFVRPDPDPGPQLPILSKSVLGKLNDGSERSFPGLVDYVGQLVSQGVVRDLDDLIQNYSHLIGEIFFQWISTGQLGCLFAAKLARKPRENRWLPIVQLNALAEGARLGNLLNAHLDVASDSHEAAVIILPDITKECHIIELVNNLCSNPSGRWYRTDDGIDPDPSGALCLVGLRWVLKTGTSVNYVLGFAPLPTMPFTRQSPFTALFLRIKEHKRTPAHREEGRVQVHLADLDSTFYPQERHDQVWELTKKARANQVEPNMTRAARARVTFALPEGCVNALCQPKHVAIEKEA
jgi:hypothetical protein